MKFAWSTGDGRGQPVFDPKKQMFSARSPYFRWVFQCGEQPAAVPFQMKALVGLEEWKGHVGLVWGIRPDPDSPENSNYLAYGVEYRQMLDEPPKLIIREINMPRRSFDIVGVDGGTVLHEITVDPPGKSEMLLEIDVTAKELKVRWGGGLDLGQYPSLLSDLRAGCRPGGPGSELPDTDLTRLFGQWPFDRHHFEELTCEQDARTNSRIVGCGLLRLCG